MALLIAGRNGCRAKNRSPVDVTSAEFELYKICTERYLGIGRSAVTRVSHRACRDHGRGHRSSAVDFNCNTLLYKTTEKFRINSAQSVDSTVCVSDFQYSRGQDIWNSCCRHLARAFLALEKVSERVKKKTPAEPAAQRTCRREIDMNSSSHSRTVQKKNLNCIYEHRDYCGLG